jgi:hypothetical protein
MLVARSAWITPDPFEKVLGRVQARDGRLRSSNRELVDGLESLEGIERVKLVFIFGHGVPWCDRSGRADELTGVIHEEVDLIV